MLAQALHEGINLQQGVHAAGGAEDASWCGTCHCSAFPTCIYLKTSLHGDLKHFFGVTSASDNLQHVFCKQAGGRAGGRQGGA